MNKPDYVTALEAAYGAPSREAFGSAVFFSRSKSAGQKHERRLLMYKVYLAIPRALDELLGHVREDGKVFRSRVGIDDRVGEVNPSSGKVYAERFGPDHEIGHVDLTNGKVYLRRLGPDKHVGSVDGHGHMYRHVRMAKDEYIGKVDRFVSYAHSAGAMLLRVLPAFEQGDVEETEAPDQG